jgi:hypothetical protein
MGTTTQPLIVTIRDIKAMYNLTLLDIVQGTPPLVAVLGWNIQQQQWNQLLVT